MPEGGKQTAISPTFVRRVAQGVRYAISGVSPSTWFGPLQPLAPMAPDDVKGRQFDYQTGYNLVTTPGFSDGSGGWGSGVSFEDLRALADNCDILRSVIETRKDQMEALEWTIKIRPDDENKRTKATSEQQNRIHAITEFFRSPDKEHTWEQWLRMWLEDMFVIDAVCFYKRRTRRGDLFSLDIIDGSTIKILSDDEGRRPMPPDPAYQQILHGIPAADFSSDELLYLKHNPRSHKFYGHCYDSETEVLTRRGWLRFSEVQGNDEIATRSLDTKAFEWQVPSEIINQPYEGEMIHFTSRTVDLLVTPNHRMLVNSLPRKLGGGSGRNWGVKKDVVVKAADLIGSHNREIKIPMTSTWHGTAVADKHFEALPDEEIERRVANGVPCHSLMATSHRVKDFTISGNDYCALLGAYLAEGNVRAQGGIEIAQRDTSKGYLPYARLLSRVLKGKPQHNGNAFVIPRPCISEHFRKFGHAHEKAIPNEVMNASPEQLRLFWDHLVLGDGHYAARKSISGRGKQPPHTEQITTTSKRLADQLVEVAQKLGFSAAVRHRRIAGKQLICGNLCNVRDSYVVTARYSQAMSFTPKRTHYTGRIHCVTVPNGIIYVRRNGKPAWCGNSHVEQVLVTVNILIRRTLHQLEYYRDGSIPDAWLMMPKEWTTQQATDFQKYIDGLLSGNSAQKRKVRIIPEAKYEQTKPPVLKDEYDEFLARILCFVFSLPPTAFVKQQNRATAESAKEQAMEEGLAPIQNYVRNNLNRVIATDFESADLVFDWLDNREMDPATAATIRQGDVKAGIVSIDEGREEMGLDPLGGAYAIPMPLTATGYVAIKSPEEQDQDAQAQQQAMSDAAAARMKSSGINNDSESDDSGAQDKGGKPPAKGKKDQRADTSKLIKGLKKKPNPYLLMTAHRH